MKFQLAHADGTLITRVEPHAITVNDQVLTQSFLVFPDQGAELWSGFTLVRADAASIWQRVVEYKPAVVVIGTGLRHVFPHPSVLRPLIDARIGYEVMGSAAACRTYNVLQSEGRKVCAAITIEPA